MINLMYVVLMAMLALNVSTEVLDGFSLVQESLQRTTENATKQNMETYNCFVDLMEKDSAEVKVWYDKATRVKDDANALFNLTEELKVAIVKKADGPNGDINNIIAKDDLESAAHVMLADGVGRGKELTEAVNSYRELMLSLATDNKQRKFISKAIHLDMNHAFESMPVAAAITLLTKLQSDIRYAEGEVMHNLYAGYKHKDEPYFKPEGKSEIKILVKENKNISKVPNEGSHFATLAADLMNVLYAGFDNPLSISVSGVPLSSVSLNMSGGTLTSTGNGHYIARPAAVGTPVSFAVAIAGKPVGTFDFKVRKLPDPAPYIPTGDDRFKGGGMAKAGLMSAGVVKAAIDDGLLDIEFQVNSFEAVFFDTMGNAVPVASNGSAFSQRQKDMIRQLSRNKRFYITHVSATGPDKITRNLKTSMEVIIKEQAHKPRLIAND